MLDPGRKSILPRRRGPKGTRSPGRGPDFPGLMEKLTELLSIPWTYGILAGMAGPGSPFGPDDDMPGPGMYPDYGPNGEG